MISRKDKFFCLIFVILLCIFFQEILFHKASYFYGDTQSQFWPWKDYARRKIVSGEFPFYNPYNFGGIHFFGNLQSAIFYPPGIIFFIFPFCPAFKIHIFLHFFFSGFFLFLGLKKLGLRSFPSACGGLIFSLNGYIVSRIEFISALSSLSWAGGFMLFSESILFFLLLCLSFTAGHPQTFLSLLLFAFIFNCFFRKNLKKKVRRAGMNPAPTRRGDLYGRPSNGVKYLVFSLILFVLLCLPQIVSTLQMAGESARLEYSSDFLLNYSLKPVKIIASFFSPLKGKIDDNFSLHSLYVGIFTIFLLLLGTFRKFLKKSEIRDLFRRERKLFSFAPLDSKHLTGFSLILVFLGLFLGLGRYNPFYCLLIKIPPFSFFRYPTNYLFISILGASILAGEGSKNIKGFLRALLILFIFIDFYIWKGGVNPTVDNRYFLEKPQVLKLLDKERENWRLYITPVTYQTRWQWRVRNPLKWTEFKENIFPNLNMLWGINEINGYDPLPPEKGLCLWGEIDQAGSLEAALPVFKKNSVRYVLSMKETEIEGYRCLRKGNGLIANLYEVEKFQSISPKKRELPAYFKFCNLISILVLSFMLRKGKNALYSFTSLQ